MTRNEAAERLRREFGPLFRGVNNRNDFLIALDAALATERRLTVERVRSHAFGICVVCGVAVDDPEAREYCKARDEAEKARGGSYGPRPALATPRAVPAAPPTHDFPSKTHVLPKPSSPRPKPVPPPWRGGAVPAAPTDDGEAVNGSREWWERFAMEQGARAERAEAALDSLTERYTVKGHVKVRHGDIEHPANADCRICDALNYSPFVRAGAVPAAPTEHWQCVLPIPHEGECRRAVPAAPSLDDCPCGHDENEHVHYCSAITEDGESCHCVQEYARLSSPEASSEGGSE